MNEQIKKLVLPEDALHENYESDNWDAGWNRCLDETSQNIDTLKFDREKVEAILGSVVPKFYVPDAVDAICQAQDIYEEKEEI